MSYFLGHHELMVRFCVDWVAFILPRPRLQNKKTYLILKALEVSDPELHNQLLDHMTTPTVDERQKIEQVTSILKRLNIPETAEAEKRRHQQFAFDQFLAVNVPQERKEALRGLAEKLLGRDT